MENLLSNGKEHRDFRCSQNMNEQKLCHQQLSLSYAHERAQRGFLAEKGEPSHPQLGQITRPLPWIPSIQGIQLLDFKLHFHLQ
jgi:hypothetical protein